MNLDDALPQNIQANDLSNVIGNPFHDHINGVMTTFGALQGRRSQKFQCVLRFSSYI
jgi:hypothetical protein